MTGSQNSSSGWTIGRVLGLLVGLIGMAGFGLCSLFGIVVGSSSLGNLATVMAYVLPGLGITYLFFLLARTMIRRARGAPRE